METDLERGPFRSAEPTREARRARERQASWARVEQQTEIALADERSRERRRDRLAWAALAVALVLTGVVAALFASTDGVGAPLSCPALALLCSCALVVRWRRTVRR